MKFLCTEISATAQLRHWTIVQQRSFQVLGNHIVQIGKYEQEEVMLHVQSLIRSIQCHIVEVNIVRSLTLGFMRSLIGFVRHLAR
jgi:hypothetical protein